MSFGQLAKYTSAMYSEMPAADKEHWQQQAAIDKERYLNELSHYVPPPGFDARGDAIVPVKRGGKRNNRDQNAPKRNMSAYLLYQNAMREQFKLDNPGMTFGQLSKYTSHMYRTLTTEEKNMWESRAAQVSTAALLGEGGKFGRATVRIVQHFDCVVSCLNCIAITALHLHTHQPGQGTVRRRDGGLCASTWLRCVRKSPRSLPKQARPEEES